MSTSVFPTDKKESFKSKLTKLGLNIFPAYRGTGARAYFLSADWREAHIKLGLTWRTKNYVGTVFGGSIYAALDPIYMVQLINILGKEYVVWDKSAVVNFLKPIKKTVYARFLITDELLADIRAKIAADKKYVIDLPVFFRDAEGIIYAEVIKTIYIADAAYYKSKRDLKAIS